nr:MAG TPA: outer capsid protein sigma-1 attachment protein [Caudoviricetes sp.]
MSINVKKYTKEQMAKMVEDAQEAAKKTNGCMNELRSRNSELELQVRALKAKNAAMTEQIDQMNGEAINKANEIANLKADADALRNKLAYTEAALGRANAEVSRLTVGCRQVEEERDYMHQQWSNAKWDANYAEAHPWRNLWAWVKRKLSRE